MVIFTLSSSLPPPIVKHRIFFNPGDGMKYDKFPQRAFSHQWWYRWIIFTLLVGESSERGIFAFRLKYSVVEWVCDAEWWGEVSWYWMICLRILNIYLYVDLVMRRSRRPFVVVVFSFVFLMFRIFICRRISELRELSWKMKIWKKIFSRRLLYNINNELLYFLLCKYSTVQRNHDLKKIERIRKKLVFAIMSNSRY